MKTLSLSILSALVALAAVHATAQTTTDEARAMAAARTAEQQRQARQQPPVLEQTAPGDYRAEAHQRERMRQWQADQDAQRAYRAGVRSQPLPVTSTDSARAEAHRVNAEQALAARAIEHRATASAK